MAIYNGAAFVEQALAGLCKQSFGEFTLLVSDNASTDGTSEILRAWAARDSRITVHRHDVNIGATANFRYVLDQTRTEYVLWHAHDDWVAPNYLEELIRIMRADADCGLACGAIIEVDPRGAA